MVAFLWRFAITLPSCADSAISHTMVLWSVILASELCLVYAFFRFSRATLEGFSMLEGLLGGAGNHGNEDSGHVL